MSQLHPFSTPSHFPKIHLNIMIIIIITIYYIIIILLLLLCLLTTNTLILPNAGDNEVFFFALHLLSEPNVLIS